MECQNARRRSCQESPAPKLAEQEDKMTFRTRVSILLSILALPLAAAAQSHGAGPRPMSEIAVPKGTTDYSGLVLSNVDLIRFTRAPATAIFAASQFDGVQILDNVTIQGTGGRDTLVINGSYLIASDWVFLDWGRRTADAVLINGTPGRDNLTGSTASDSISGGDHTDILNGGGGTDVVFGGNGKDIIIGGLGGDVLFGGKGADTFVYNSVTDSTSIDPDYISDFNQGLDKIDLGAVDAVDGGSDDSFTFIGTAGFSHMAGELRFQNNTVSAAIVEGDTNGDGLADFKIAFGVPRHFSFLESDFNL
jgi:Ca2+-binding RTX toxin-like protein